jgi:protein subunit release factor B
MSSWYSRNSVKVTHEPTGETVQIDDLFSRSQRKKKDMAIKILRSRLWAEQNGYGRSEKEVSVCDIAEEHDWWPNDWSDYREEMK